MVKIEEDALRDAIIGAFDWMRERRPGPASLMWSTGEQPVRLNFDLVFPQIQLTDEEAAFVGQDASLNPHNEALPPSFQALESVRAALFRIGGELFLKRAGKRGLVLRFAIRGQDSEEDLNAKIVFIQSEMGRQLQSSSAASPTR